MTGINEFLQEITMYANIGLYILIGFLALVAGVYFYITRFSNILNKKKKDKDYTNVKRKQSIEFVQLEDIKKKMYVNDGYTYFTAGIKCVGFDYHMAHKHEQLRVQQNYIEFFNMLEHPIQYYIQCRDVDVEDTLNRYLEAQEKVKQEIEKIGNDLESLGNEYIKFDKIRKETMVEFDSIKRRILEVNKDENTKTELEQLQKEYAEAKKKMANQIEILKNLQESIQATNKRKENKTWQYEHLEHQVAYTRAISSTEKEPQREEYYFFSYTHNRNDFSVRLTNDEIIERANKELESQANNFNGVLKRCNVRSEMLDTEGLIDIERRAYNPISGNRFKLRDIKGSNFYEMVTTSDSFKQLEKEALDEKVQETMEERKEVS